MAEFFTDLARVYREEIASLADVAVLTCKSTVLTLFSDAAQVLGREGDDWQNFVIALPVKSETLLPGNTNLKFYRQRNLILSVPRCWHAT